MSAHTPGPWKIRSYKTETGGLWIDCDNWTGPKRRGQPTALGGTVAEALASGGDVEANARLIAAAPDLLAALLDLEATYRGESETAKYILSIVRPAIARARGEK